MEGATGALRGPSGMGGKIVFVDRLKGVVVEESVEEDGQEEER